MRTHCSSSSLESYNLLCIEIPTTTLQYMYKFANREINEIFAFCMQLYQFERVDLVANIQQNVYLLLKTNHTFCIIIIWIIFIWMSKD